MIKKTITAIPIVLFLMGTAIAQEAQFPIVKGYGGIHAIPDAVESPDPAKEYKIMIDLVSASEDPKQVNRMVDNIARMVNLHGIAGIPKEKINVKVAIHGGAVYSLLINPEYKKQHGVDNPNLAVYEALQAAGVEFYICGQSLIGRNIPKEQIWSGAQLALSMLTTVTTYVPQGYTLIRF
jgi:intracellular sulfur oxidation DsrE/DsrF family protein